MNCTDSLHMGPMEEATQSHSSGMICDNCASRAEYLTTCPECGHEFLVN